MIDFFKNIIRSMYTRFAVSFIGIVIISFALSSLISIFLFEDAIKEETTGRIEATGQAILQSYKAEKPTDLKAFLNRFTSFEVVVALFNESGELTHFTANLEQEPWFRHSLDRLNLNQQEEGFYDQGDIMYYFHTIEYKGRSYSLVVFRPVNRLMDMFMYYLTTSFFISLAIGSVLIMIGTHFVIKPLKKLSHAASQVARGNLDTRVKKRGKDEIGQLAKRFNKMVSTIANTEKMREEFVSNVSHEIQTPLTSVKGFVKAMLDDVIPIRDQKKYLTLVYEETERLSRLSDQLLSLASLEAAQHPYYPEVYRLDKQLRQVVIKTEPLWKRKKLDFILCMDTVQIFGDRHLLEQVWINLLTNAIKYSPCGNKVEIKVSTTHQQTEVTVRDYGPGISAKDQERIFERFFKVDRTRNQQAPGTGLGLAITYKIVQLHGGSIRVESNLGQGTLMEVKLPNEGKW
ncbi:hypothetical protein CEN49_19190 [Fischerella thermalis CCMEE 5273]|nr:hypothetical protein CEN49_19190 [Fischerella thermalis CCMEE 5273]